MGSPVATISTPLTPPPQQLTNVATLIDGQVNVAKMLIFLVTRPGPGSPALPNTGLPGSILPGFQLPRSGLLLTDGVDYTAVGGQLTLATPPQPNSSLIAVIFQNGVALGGPTRRRYVAPWQLPLPVSGAYDGAATAYNVVFGPTIFGTVDGVNNTFTFGVSLRRAQIFLNGVMMTLNTDVVMGPTTLVFLPGALPRAGDLISMVGWP